MKRRRKTQLFFCASADTKLRALEGHFAKNVAFRANASTSSSYYQLFAAKLEPE